MNGETTSATNAKPEVDPEDRIAIVFVHGQGQQRPMEDVQELARTIWDGEPKLKRNDGKYAKTFTVPDPRLQGADFARVTTESGYYKTRVDFFEFYWADLMVGNRFEHLTTWFRQLQQRPRKEAPASILPVRQFAIRTGEAVILLAMLFAFCTALMLPAAPSAWSQEQVRQLTGLDLPHPADHPWMLGVLAFVAMLLAWFVIVVNETDGDAFRTFGAWLKQQTSNAYAPVRSMWGSRAQALDRAEEIRRNAKRGPVFASLGLAVFGVAGLALVFLVIWRGPTAEWGDLRVPLFALIATAGLVAAFMRRRLALALTISIAAAAIAFIAFFLGGVDGNNLFVFDAPGNRLNPAVSSTFLQRMAEWGITLRPGLGDHTFSGSEEALQRHEQLLAFLLMSLQFFALLWFVGGCIRRVGSLTRTYQRAISVVATIAIASLLAWGTLEFGYANPPYRWLLFSTGAILLVVTIAVILLLVVATRSFLIPVMADSARYFSRDPENVGARHNIRERGLNLLSQLHKPFSDGRQYKRIIVVAHSLGSVVAYELLNDFWSRHCGAYRLQAKGEKANATDAAKAMNEVVRLAGELRKLGAKISKIGNLKKRTEQLAIEENAKLREDYWAAQSALNAELAKCALETVSPVDKTPRGCHWLISDFITVGSPLAHGALLLADGVRDLRVRQQARKLATCPPSRDPDDTKDNGHTFKGADGSVRPVHSAVFSAVRWTNLHFKTETFILVGDAVGGDVAYQFGFGIRDIELSREDTGAVFTHNEYWKSPLDTQALRTTFETTLETKEGPISQGAVHLIALKEALRLGDMTSLVADKYKPGQPIVADDEV